MIVIRRNVLHGCYWITRNMVQDRVQRRVLENGNVLSFSKKWSKSPLGIPSKIWYCIHGSPGPNPSKHEGVMFPRNIVILLSIEVASYPRRGPVLHCLENLRTDVMSSLAKRLSHVSLIKITIYYTSTFLPFIPLC